MGIKFDRQLVNDLACAQLRAFGNLFIWITFSNVKVNIFLEIFYYLTFAAVIEYFYFRLKKIFIKENKCPDK